MRRILLTILLSALPALAAQHTVTFSWQLPELGNSPACSATVTADCVVGTNLYLVNGAALTQLNLLPVPVPTGATAATSISYTQTPWQHLGTATASATCVFKAGDGSQGESGQSVPVTFQVKPFVPGNLVAAPQ